MDVTLDLAVRTVLWILLNPLGLTCTAGDDDNVPDDVPKPSQRSRFSTNLLSKIDSKFTRNQGHHAKIKNETLTPVVRMDSKIMTLSQVQTSISARHLTSPGGLQPEK